MTKKCEKTAQFGGSTLSGDKTDRKDELLEPLTQGGRETLPSFVKSGDRRSNLGESIAVRDRAIEQLQTSPDPKLLVVGLLAMNLGQTLTRARHAFMTDLDWCPSSMVQAEGRLLRISQEQPVEVTYLLSQGTIDEDIYDLIYKKQAAINEAIDHRGQTEKVAPLSIRDFVAQMLKRRKGKR